MRLGPGRHPRPGKIVCVMELASMLAGERFSDRPPSVCPVIGAILRVYNDNVDDDRRQDLYRFAADAVDTRRDYRAQRRRADVAIDWAVDRYRSRGGKLPATPDPEGLRDEIAYYVVGSLVGRRARRGGWSDEEHGAMVSLLEELIEIERAPALEPLIERPLIGQLLEEVAQTVEHGGGDEQILFAELLDCRPETRFEPCSALLDESTTVLGERCEHDAPVVVGAAALHEPSRREPFQHLGDARRTQVGGLREVAQRHLNVVAKAEQQAVLRVGELARTVGLAPAQPSHRGHRAFERSSHVLGGVALAALALHLAKRV
ncbi:MAG: hypothetical protein WB557_25060 [Solirubrobacteraceae bacterium]